MAYLEIRTASGDVTTKPLSKSQPLSIGSHASNDLRITDEGVATMHCRIGWNGNAYEVTAALPEGVDVNGTLVERASLSAGDILLVGRTDVVYQAEESSDLGLKPLSDDEISLRRTRPTSQKPASPGPEAPPAMETSGKSRPGSKSPAGAPRSAKRESRQPAASKSPSAPRSESAEPSRAGGASADEPWDPVIGDESPSQVIHRSTTFATSAAEGEGARRTKSPVSRIRALWRSHPARPGEQDVLRSPFILSLGGGTLLLFFIGAIFWFIIARDTAKRQFNAAMSLVNEKSYSQAIQSFDKFLENYPRHKLTQQALEERGKAKIEMEIMGSTQSWARGMKALDEFIQYRRDDPGFSKLHKLVSQYAETIALGAARSAGETKDRSLLEISNQAKAILSRYGSKESPPIQAQQEIESAYASSEAAILKHETLNAALADMQKAIDAKRPMASLEARRNLLDRYADLTSNRTLVEKLNGTLDVEKSLVGHEAAERAAVRPEEERGAPRPLTLTLHTRSRTDESSNGRCVFALAGGCCFGIDAVTGEPVWRHVVGLETPFFPIEVMADVAGLLVYNSNSQALELLERTTGNLRWRQPLDEKLQGAPLVREGQIYATTEAGRLYRIDLETGGVSGSLAFSQPVHGPCAPLADGAHLAVAGDEAVVYTVTMRPLGCEAVSYVGQRPGSIQSPLMAMGRLLLMADNDRMNSCLLRVLQPADGGPRLAEVATARIDGIVRDEPILRGNELIVPSSGQRLSAFNVTDDPNKPPLTTIAAYQVQSEHDGPLYLYAGADGQLWMASGALRKFQLTTDSIDLTPKQAAVGVSTQPLQSIERYLFVGRRLVYSNAVLFTQTDRETMTGRWRIVLGGRVLQLADSGNGSALCVSESGDLFRLSEQQLRKGGFAKDAAGQLKLPDALIDPLRAAPLEDGRLAVFCGKPEPMLWILSATGLVERTVPLEVPLEADPAMISAGLVLPLPGRLKVIARSQGQPAPSEYVTGLGNDQKPRWLQVTAIDDQEILALDSSGRLARIEFRTSPLPHLAEVAGIQLKNPVDVPFVVRDRQVFLADASGGLHRLEARSLEERATAQLKPPATSGLWLVGEHLYVQTGPNRLDCFNVKNALEPLWSAPVAGDGLAGPPLLLDDGLLLAERSGDVLKLNVQNGRIEATASLGQRLNLGPQLVGRTPVALSIDGSLYPLNDLMAPAK